jgi:hypothetical protein
VTNMSVRVYVCMYVCMYPWMYVSVLSSWNRGATEV